MPVARSVSASQLARGDGTSTSPDTPEGDCHLLTQKAHTLDRFCNPSAMNGHAEPRRKRPFMSFRLSKKVVGKQKESEVSQNPGGSGNSVTEPQITENGVESIDGGSDSSSASVKPKKKYLTRVSSFVSRVASKVQGNGTVQGPNVGQRGRLERSKTISVSDLRSGPNKPPEDYVEFEEGHVPGSTGIRNHGNTCFINAVIQCLSHTDLLSEYFVLDQYKLDLARCNKINSKKYGTRGEITEQLAILLKALWTCRYVPDLSMNFKNTVDKYESLYRGSQQHDAAEFLMFVLDKVHEDLNTASKRKYKKIKNTYGRPDEVVAAETLANHLRCNSSFIHDIFQAQFRSSLKCPHCHKESNTFDPFLCVSIPIPQRHVLPIFVCVVYLNQQPKQVQLGLSIDGGASIKELRKQLSEDCGIAADTLIITELDGEGFHRTFGDASPVTVISESDPIYAIELPRPRPPTQDTGSAVVLLTWINVILADPDNIRFGGVYQSQVVRDVSYPDLQKLLLKEMTTMVTTQTLTSHQQSGLFIIGVDDGGSCVVGLEAGLDVPLFHPCVEQALALCDATAGPPHLKLVLQWSLEAKEKYIVDDVDHIDEHLSVRELRQNPHQCASVSLHQCLQLHTSAEKLGCGDAWHCPTCNRKQQVVKRLMLWSAPQILVIHLKRFRQGTLQTNSSKLSTTVKFPLSGFDISDHVASKPTNNHNNSTHNGGGGNLDSSGVLGSVWSPWKRPKRHITHGSDESVYDLYAVCYHHGKDMQGGHYTAMCKNTADNKWYSFDDSKVEVANEDQVVSPDAYILFYQRRSDASHLSSCSEGSLPEHWAFRIPLSYLPPALTPQINKEVKAPAPFERGRSYGTLPVNGRTQRGSSSEREHCSDTEAPLAAHEESPILKRQSTGTLPETEVAASNSPEASQKGLKVETVRVDVVARGSDAIDGDMECEMSKSLEEKDGDQVMTELEDNQSRKNSSGGEASRNSLSDSGELSRTSSLGGKTVLISRCQAVRDQDLNGITDTNKVHNTDTGGSTDDEASHVPSLESQESSESRGEEEDDPEMETPEVRIHPATPEVLAAHQGHTNAQLTKRSVITVTLRPRNPSESSTGSNSGSREIVGKDYSRESSSTGGREGRSSRLSSCSSSSAVSIAVNGTDEVPVPYQNGHSDDRDDTPDIRIATPEIRITPLIGKVCDPVPIMPSPMKVSTRCMNANKTASFVIINTPSASPRQPRPKTPSNGSYPTSSQRPYTSKTPTKSRDSSVESLKSQRSTCTSSRKENGVCTRKDNSTSMRKENGVSVKKESTVIVRKENGVSGRKENGVSGRKENGISGRKENGISGRKENRATVRKENGVSGREENGVTGKHIITNGRSNAPIGYSVPIKNGVGPKHSHRQDRGDNKGDARYCREERYEREGKYERRYDRDGKYDRDRNYERDGRYEGKYERNYDGVYEREGKYERDGSYEGKYEREAKYEREGKYERDRHFERDGRYDQDGRYDGKYNREGKYDRDGRYENKYDRDSWYERDRHYDHPIKDRDGRDMCERDNKYDRDCKYERDKIYDSDRSYSRESRYERDIYDREAYERERASERNFRFEREYEYGYEGEGKCSRELIYERDLDWRDERCDRECICDRRPGSGAEGSTKSRSFENRDHYHTYPKVLSTTATNPTVITESSV